MTTRKIIVRIAIDAPMTVRAEWSGVDVTQNMER